MKLDSRILEGKRPLTCLDIEQAREFVGKECIFSDCYKNFKDLNKYQSTYPEITAVLSIDKKPTNEEYAFRNTNINLCYGLILPLEWVKEPEPKKTYRPYTLDEFIRAFNVGDVLHIRNKRTNYTATLIYNGYSKSSIGTCIYLGANKFTLDMLFKTYEISKGCGSNEIWHPFGIEEIEKIEEYE